MDDDKKYTTENEGENDIENKNRTSEFDDFNFTDDFPDEFSEEFMKSKPNDQPETVADEPFNPEQDLDDDFLSKDKYFSIPIPLILLTLQIQPIRLRLLMISIISIILMI